MANQYHAFTSGLRRPSGSPSNWRNAWLSLASALLLSGCDQPPPPSPPPPPQVEVATPESRSVTEYFYYTGTLVPVATAEIRARVEGTLETMNFDESTRVEAGTVLFTIEKLPYEVAVGQAEAAIARASAAQAVAEAGLSRTQEAFEMQAASEIELIEAQAAVKQAEADMLSAQQSLRQAKLNLSYTDVKTPIAGRIDRNYVDVGNLVGRDGPTLLASVEVMDPLHVYFDVSESIVLRYLEVGKNTPREAGFPPVELALADEDGYPHKGRVDFSGSSVDGATGTLTVRAKLENPSGKLYPGLFARIRVPWETRENAVVVHEEAIGTGLDGKYVLVVGDDNTVSRRVVELGERQDNGTIVVLSGLNATERYIVRGIQKARPGAPVSPKNFEPADEANPASTGDQP